MPNAIVPAAATGLPKSTPPAIPPLDLDSFPDRYRMIVSGDCLAPDLPDGSIVEASKSEPYAPGDFIVVYLRPEFVPVGHLQGALKRLVTPPPSWVTFPWKDHPQSDVRALVLLEMLKPRRQFRVLCSEILAIHKCLGPAPAGRSSALRQMEASNG